MISALILLTAQVSASSDVHTFTVDGSERKAIIYAPSQADGKAHPIVFVFHGHGGNMYTTQRAFGAAFRKDFPEATMIYPQGLPTKGMTDPEGAKNGWQQKKGDYGDRDLKFFDAMMNELRKDASNDMKRVYVTGHSNGGRMTYLLWAERGNQLRAVAPSASPAVLNITSATKIPAFIVAGEKDPIVPFAWQSRSIEAVRKLLGTDHEKAKKDGYLTIEKGPNGVELDTYIFPGQHTVPPEAAVGIAKFFERLR